MLRNTTHTKPKRTPWLNDEIRNKCQIKRQLYEEVLRGRITRDVYKQYSSHLHMTIQEAKRRYNTNLILNSNNKIKTTWKLVNNLTGKQGRTSINLESLSNHYNATKTEILNSMNSFYIEVGKGSVATSDNAHKNVRTNNKSMVLYDTEPVEVFNTICSLKNTMAVGADGLPTKLVKHCADVLCHPLSCIINFCFKTGRFPELLKTTVIKPIYKGGDKNNIENYRPIALTSTIAKVVEKVILTRLVQFTQSSNILTERQNAYIQGRSTIRAIYMALCKINEALSRREHVVGVFLDLSKAFDRVDHSVLLTKLWLMGFRGNVHDLLRSYLTDRVQTVRAAENGEVIQSTWLKSERGIPQGSILGPFLFSCIQMTYQT